MGRGVAIALGALLFISLGLNVFALGHLSGRMIAGRHAGPPPHSEGHRPRGGFEDPLKIMRYAEELSPELRQQFRESFRAQLPQMREEYRKMHQLRGDLSGLMSAEEWDGAAIDAKLEEIRAVEDRQQKAFIDAFIGVFEALPAEERKALIDAANEKRAERRKRWKERVKHRREDFGPEKDGGMPPPPEEN
ncbi:periplasmic heavy metal sensor [Hyphococcus luteus]|jgi:uncharacterized membrane protein|uniref:Periplasmic heavy metal sensor n=1 Tax=Hyphococcus luteus TaxID=2058213 RepID=A0A2S7K442_9PROT|nr:periplasmic heavy metal sensor [Marinicaulis flavus]PQA87267.1 hypothetical protein CW354_12605 [Marinicaulis flavus]